MEGVDDLLLRNIEGEVPVSTPEQRGSPRSDLECIAGLLDKVVASHVRALVEDQLADIQRSLSNLEAHLLHKHVKVTREGDVDEDDGVGTRVADGLDDPRPGEAERTATPDEVLDASDASQSGDYSQGRDRQLDSGKAESGDAGCTRASTDGSRRVVAHASSSLHMSTQPANELWAVWAEAPASIPSSLSASHQLSAMMPDAHLLKVRLVAPQDALYQQSELVSGVARFVIRPNSRLRFYWDMSSLALLCYDVVFIPLSVFEVGLGGAFRWIDLFITTFWTLDVAVCFFSGFYRAGVVELRPAQIARKYVRGTFAFDMCILAVDWVLALSDLLDIHAIRLFRSGKLVRFGKVFRMVRLLRAFKLEKMLNDIGANIQSKSLQTALGIARAATFIIVINHYVACIWYEISSVMHRVYDEPAWVGRLHEEGRREHGIYFYLTALHWSITQFTPASMEVQPRNSVERIYVICVVFGALVVFSTFVSSITAAMTHLREFNKERYNQEESIESYLKQKKISFELSSKINSFIRAYNFLARREVREEDIAVFKALPTPMKLMLRFEAHGPILAGRPFFYQLNEYDSYALGNICFSTITELPVGLAHEVFEPGQDASNMYFLLRGHVEYNMEEISEHFWAGSGSVVFCEAALWIRFQHPGRLFCKSSSEFLAVSSGVFRRIIPNNPELHSCCCQYAAKLLEVLQHDDVEGLLVADRLDLDRTAFDALQEIAQKAFEKVDYKTRDEKHRAVAFQETVETRRLQSQSQSD